MTSTSDTPRTDAVVRKCAALTSADPPQDCDAPFCGCNPEWTKTIEALQELGWGPLSDRERELRECVGLLTELGDDDLLTAKEFVDLASRARVLLSRLQEPKR